MTVQELIVILQTVPAPTNTEVSGVAAAAVLRGRVADLEQQVTPLTQAEDAGTLALGA